MPAPAKERSDEKNEPTVVWIWRVHPLEKIRRELVRVETLRSYKQKVREYKPTVQTRLVKRHEVLIELR